MIFGQDRALVEPRSFPSAAGYTAEPTASSSGDIQLIKTQKRPQVLKRTTVVNVNCEQGWSVLSAGGFPRKDRRVRAVPATAPDRLLT